MAAAASWPTAASCNAGEPVGRPARRRRQRSTESRAAGIVNMADFDATLYFLDEREIEYLQDGDPARVRAGPAREHRRACCSTSSRRSPTRTFAAEVLDDLQTVMVYLLTAGHFRGVANLLREAQAAVDARGRRDAGASRATRAAPRNA